MWTSYDVSLFATETTNYCTGCGHNSSPWIGPLLERGKHEQFSRTGTCWLTYSFQPQSLFRSFKVQVLLWVATDFKQFVQ
jgi:hypothetical protein